MVLAVLYVLHVPFAIPRFPNLAIDVVTESGKFNAFNDSAVHPPVGPYFVLPKIVAGWNLVLVTR